jgi:D-alanyl-lipoteichoic acid acyltransferase DltB (MBOAT superfamily)
MLFNSLNFAIFLPIVFILYWFATNGNFKLQNILLLASSYFFYACWDWKFLFLLIFSTLLDYYTGIKIYEATHQRKKMFWLWLSIIINVGFLGVFKYYNFFASSFAGGLSLLGFKINLSLLQVVLPVGISFYTFHGLSYVIDLYKNRIKPERNFVDYSVFVSFFPLLVAGPIERATHLLVQINKKRAFNYLKAVDGLRQILWGLFKKIVIADHCADYANTVFINTSNYSGSILALGAFFFAIQIYCDFSGYSDIALGTARLFGIELLRNFAFPYFSRDIAEFWRRWHISLSSWFKDYLYIPLGGSKGSLLKKLRNTFIIFIVSGFWHGANWTFIVWGFLNALYIVPSIIFNTNRNNIHIVAKGKIFPTGKEFFDICVTFSLTTFAWIFFRSTDIPNALTFISRMFSKTIFLLPNMDIFIGCPLNPLITIVFIFILIVVEWIGREHGYALADLDKRYNRYLRWFFYFIISLSIFLLAHKSNEFIYFQF